jgi:hypothetical protein
MRRPPTFFAALAVVVALLALPAAASAQGSISSLIVEPSQVNNGASTTGTVTLAFPDPSPTTVLVFSSDPSAAQVPPSFVIPAGQQTGTFTITTNAAAPFTPVQITAWVGNVPRTANISVNQAPAGGLALNAVSLNPSTVTGGSPTTGTVTFNRATDGANVQLFSSNTALARVPSEVTVNRLATTAAFPVSTSPVTTQTSVTIRAVWLSITRTATLTLRPGAPAAADVVRIQTARWDRGLLRIEATSTNSRAIRSVHSRSGEFMFTLTNRGGGRYSDQRGWVFDPIQITVRSNLGGSATARTSR